MKVGIVGCGAVGSLAAYATALCGIAPELGYKNWFLFDP